MQLMRNRQWRRGQLDHKHDPELRIEQHPSHGPKVVKAMHKQQRQEGQSLENARMTIPRQRILIKSGGSPLWELGAQALL